MKLIRHLTPSGPAYAALQADGSARAVTGDILGDFRVTDQVVKPGKLLAPLQPTNLLCIGLNYKDHAAETNNPAPKEPPVFPKWANAIQDPGEPILRPRGEKTLDLIAGELAAVREALPAAWDELTARSKG